MRHPYRLAMTGLLLLTPALASSLGCADADVPEDEDVESAAGALLGQVNVDGTCSAGERDFLLDAAMRGRAIANSSAFEACIRALMNNATTLADDVHLGRVVPELEGPYFRCQGDPVTPNPADTVVALTRSNLDVSISCQPTGDRGESAYALVTTNPGSSEAMTYIETSLQSSIATEDQNYVASVLWHEAMHQHGYTHGDKGFATECGYSSTAFGDNDELWMRRHTVPYIVSACMTYLGDVSDECRDILSCRPDEVPIRSGFSSSSFCVCGHDPGWHRIGTLVVNRIAVARDLAGDLEVAGISPPNGTLSVATQTQPNGAFGGWTTIPSSGLTQVDLGKNQDGRLEAFAVGSDGALYHVWQNSSRVWGAWESLGRSDVKQVAAATSPGGVLNAFVLTTTGSVLRTSQVGPNAGWSGLWESLGGSGITAIRVGNNQDGRPEVFAIGGNKTLYHQWQWGGTTTWSGWSSLGRTDVDQVAVANESDGSLTAFVRAGGAIYATTQSGPNGGWSGAWTPLWGTGLRDVSAARGADGHVRVFAVGDDYQAYVSVESSPLAFGPWALVPGTSTYRSLTTALDQAGRVNIVGVGNAGGGVSQVAVP